VTVFVDSSAWFAAANKKDSNNTEAVRLLGQHANLLTSNLVVTETWLLINSRAGFADAQRFWGNMRKSQISVAQVLPEDLDVAWTVAQHFSDQHFSLIDCSGFVLMERLKINRVISFDNDFVIYRYGSQRDRAFEVLR
jgi:uncharacterized protein